MLLADKPTRSIGELADYAEKLLIVRGINLPYNSTGCSHSAADAQILTAQKITSGSTNCKAMGISVDTAIAKAMNPPGRDPLCLHAGMFSPGGTGFDIPGYVSCRHAAAAARCTSIRRTRPTSRSSASSATGALEAGLPQRTEAQRRALRSKSINDALRPQIKALLARTDLAPERP